ncbi:MAG TPA: histidine kinase [Saprospiraceae bacterium]|nr:histidine kinase [Saprospiraceae bacterium]
MKAACVCIPGLQLIFILQMITWVSVFGLEAQRVFHMDMDNGLCTNALTDLTCDHNGNMWIGSLSGLMRFGGTHIKCITKVGPENDAISGLEMHSIAEDNCGNIWFGSSGELNRIDPVTFEVEKFPIRPPYEGSSSVGYIYSVYVDKYNTIWMGTDVAMFRFDINTGHYEAVPTDKDEHSVPFYTVSYNGFVETEEGLWMSTGGGMAYYDYKKNEFLHRYHNPDKNQIFDVTWTVNEFQSDMELDSKGRLWYVRGKKELACYDLRTQRLDTFKFELPKGTWGCCWSICVDAQQNIWIGTRHGGVLIFNTTTKTFESLKNDGINRLIQSHYIYAIERGPGGQVFVAHDNGLDIIDLYDLSLRELHISARPDFLNLKYESGDISLNGMETAVYIPFYHYGFYKFDLGTDSITSFVNPLEYGDGTPLIYNVHGQEYAALKGNLYEIKTRDQTYDVVQNTLLPDTISHIKGHVVWCYMESPVSAYIKKSSGKVLHVKDGSSVTYSNTGFKPNICLSPDSQTISYLTPRFNLIRRNLNQVNVDTIYLQHYLDTSSFSFSNPRHMVDDGHSVWMTGQNGILRFDYINKALHSYGVEKGLSHSFTFSIVLDLDKNVWVGSIGGIDKYEQDEDRFVSVYRVKGNTYMDAFGSAVCSSKGIIIFHFGNKIVRILPDLKPVKRAAPLTIHLDEVLVNGRSIDWQDEQKLDNLTYVENRLTFVFDMFYYDDPDLATFHYRLNGKEWIDNGKRNEINLDGLGSGSYQLELRGSVGSQADLTSVFSIPFRIRVPWWKEWWFLSLLFLTAASGIWVYFRSRIKKFRNEILIARQITDLESKALRAQMNPHFVFNSLNAIQECIVTGKVEEAYTYLSTFSKLLRMVLEHSDVPEVALNEELEVFGLYMTLEKLRFKDDMKYVLNMDKELDPEEISIPPMLIQPHLENALWHGLRHKEGDKHLFVTIKENPAGYLEVIIEDDGIGRTRAGEIRQHRLGAGKHRSKGKQLSENRMVLLKNSYPSTSMDIIDLYDTEGNAAGTKVILTIPMIEKRNVNAN